MKSSSRSENFKAIAEGNYFQSIFCLIFTFLGMCIDAEVRTNKGRVDAVIHTADAVFVFEFKLNDTRESL